MNHELNDACDAHTGLNIIARDTGIIGRGWSVSIDNGDGTYTDLLVELPRAFAMKAAFKMNGMESPEMKREARRIRAAIIAAYPNVRRYREYPAAVRRMDWAA